jgi:hypothetical protein
MNLRRPIFPALALALVATAAAQTVNTKLINRTQDRIAALYQHQDQRAAPPEARSNPFRIGGDAATPMLPAGPGESAPVDPASRDALLLRQAAATIKVTGVFNIAGRMHIAVNQSTYREGALIPVPLPGETVFVRVVEITMRSATLRLEDAELTIKF